MSSAIVTHGFGAARLSHRCCIAAIGLEWAAASATIVVMILAFSVLLFWFLRSGRGLARRLEKLSRMAGDVACCPPEEVVAKALDFALTASSSLLGSVSILDTQDGRLKVVVTRPEHIWTAAMRATVKSAIDEGRGLVGRAGREGTIVDVGTRSELAAESDFVEIVSGVQSEIALPFELRGNRRGVLHLESKRKHAYGGSQLEYLRLIASQMALALDREYEAQRFTRQAELGHAFSKYLRGVLSAGAGLEDIFAHTLSLAKSIANARYSSLWIVERQMAVDELDMAVAAAAPTRDVIFMRAADGYDPDKVRVTELDLSEHVMAECIDRSDIVFIANVHEEPTYKPRNIARDLGLRSLIMVPIRAYGRDESTGVLNVYPREDAEPSSEVKAYLLALAGVISAAMHVAYLRESERQLAALTRLPFSDLEQGRESFLREVALNIKEGVHAETCSIFLLEGSRADMVATTSERPLEPASDLDRFLVQATLQSRDPILVSDFGRIGLPAEEIAFRELPGVPPKSFLSVPLTAGEQVIGLMRCINKHSSRFSRSEHFTRGDTELIRVQAQTVRLFVENLAFLRERELAEQERREYLARLRHEIRSPLQSIMAHVYWLGSRYSPQDPAFQVSGTKKFQDLRDFCEVLSMLTAGTAVLDEQVEPRREPLDLRRDVVLPCVKSLQGSAGEKGLRIDCSQWSSSVRISGDKHLLMMTFFNLIRNAVSYSQPSSVTGRPEISVSCSQDHPEAGRYYVIGVSDYGLAIQEHEKDRIFKRYARGSDADSFNVSGTGQGLAICKAVMQAHGGRIEVTSLDNPTVISLLFPKRQ